MNEEMPQNRTQSAKYRTVAGGIGGAILSAIASGGAALAISCCAGPAFFIALGLGAGGAAVFEKLAPYRLIFSVLSVAMLGFSFWNLYLRKTQCDSSCSPKASRTSKLIFWVAGAVVSASLILPSILDSIMMKR